MIAIHGGAGFYNNNEHIICKKILKKCKLDMLLAIMELEINPLFNCGYGSNLTKTGKVECEASYMYSENLAFGAVGAVSNCFNPICAAKLLANNFKTLENWDLIPPFILVGSGANDYCKQNFPHLKVEKNEDLQTETAKRDFLKVTKLTTDKNLKNLDTVGGVKMLINGECESSASSGGIIYKTDGRLGHCSQFGAGIWSEKQNDQSISISLSGCGEALVRTHLAKKIAKKFFQLKNNVFIVDWLKNLLIEKFLQSKKLNVFPVERRLFGGILFAKRANLIELIVFHNTKNFVYSFYNGKSVKYQNSCLKTSEDIVCQSIIV